MKTSLILILISSLLAGCAASNVRFSRALLLNDYSRNTGRKYYTDSSKDSKFLLFAKDSVYQVAAIIPVIENTANHTQKTTIWSGHPVKLRDSFMVALHVPQKYLADTNNFVTYKLLIKAVKAENAVVPNKHVLKNAAVQEFNSREDVTNFHFLVMSKPVKEPIYIVDLYNWDLHNIPIKAVIGDAIQKKIDLNKLPNKDAVIECLYNYKNKTGEKTNTPVPVIQTTYKTFVRIGDYLIYKELKPIRGGKDNYSTFDLDE